MDGDDGTNWNYLLQENLGGGGGENRIPRGKRDQKRTRFSRFLVSIFLFLFCEYFFSVLLHLAYQKEKQEGTALTNSSMGFFPRSTIFFFFVFFGVKKKLFLIRSEIRTKGKKSNIYPGPKFWDFFNHKKKFRKNAFNVR